MMDDLGTGVITKLVDGKFDGQYNVEITLPDGTVLSGYDGISVYEKKQDGSPAKVWPMVQQSKFQGVPFFWKANVKESETKGGTKTYATIVWAEPAEDVGGDGERTDSRGSGSAPQPSPSDDWTAPKVGVGASAESPPATATPAPAPASPKVYGGKKDDVDWEARTLEIEAAWAIGVLLNKAGQEHVSEQKLVQDAIRLVLLKRQVAAELAN